MNPVTTEFFVGAIVGGSESFPVAVVPELSRSTTPAEIVPLLACTRMETPATSGAKCEMLRSTVECGGTMMPFAPGGLSGPRLDHKLIATFAGASAGLTKKTRSATPTRPSMPTNHQSVPGGRQVRSDRPRPSPKAINEVWLATTPSAPSPAAATATAPYGVALCTTTDGLRLIDTACCELLVPNTGVYAAVGGGPAVMCATVMSVVRPPGPPETVGQTRPLATTGATPPRAARATRPVGVTRLPTIAIATITTTADNNQLRERVIAASPGWADTAAARAGPAHLR